MAQIIIAVVITAVVAILLTYVASNAHFKKVSDEKIGSAEDRARAIIDEAVKSAETKKREALLEVKEESIKTKNELDKEIKDRRSEIQRNERRVEQKEANLDKKLEAIERREQSFAVKEEEIKRQKAEVAKLNEERIQELERISGLTSEQAKEYLLKTVEEDVKLDTAKLIKEMEHQAKEEAGKKAKEYVVNAIQKCAADHVPGISSVKRTAEAVGFLRFQSVCQLDQHSFSTHSCHMKIFIISLRSTEAGRPGQTSLQAFSF